MTTTGKRIFSERVEYPLPRRKGVKDYLFYFVPASDPYGSGARHFFDRFYKHHVRKDVKSLEDLLNSLHVEVTSKGVSLIREVVILAHGSPMGLQLAVVKGASKTNLPEFRHLTAFSLACLQKDIQEGKFADLARKRKEVVARLRNDSWITIRACRVGRSAECMYGIYSFFGGRANVYAPREYQFFGSLPIMEGTRLETRLEAHHHLVRQRFFPSDLHTPERKDTVVRFLIDPARFAEPFTVASTRVDNPAPEYEALIDGLNRRRLSSALKERFDDVEHELSGRAQVRVTERNRAWVITSFVRHAGKLHSVEYEIVEEIRSARTEAALVAWARLVAIGAKKTQSTSQTLPLQLFFDEPENRTWTGRLFELAGYADSPQPPPEGDPDSQPEVDPELKRTFDAVLALLNGGEFSDGAVDIRALFKAEGDIELSEAAVIKSQSATGSGSSMRITWVIEDQERYIVKLEHPLTDEGSSGHTIAVYHGLQGDDLKRYQVEQMGRLGSNPDTPGTELPAYFDRFDFDGLMEVMDHLRSPYRAEHSYYIHHAQQAVARKKDYFKWWQEQYAEKARNEPFPEEPHAVLSPIEMDDKHLLAHDFDFNGTWQEVKASHPSPGEFQDDLFTEEDLWKKFRRKEDLANRSLAPEVEDESPGISLEDVRRMESKDFERFFSAEKFMYEPSEADEEVKCEELAEALEKWKELQGKPPDEIERLLDLEKTASGATKLDHIHWIYDKLKIAKMGLDLFNMATLRTGITVRIVEKIPAFAPSTLGVPTALGRLLRVAPAITVPLTVWMNFLDAQSQAMEADQHQGKLTAIRQWLRAVRRWTRSTDFPDNLAIEMDESEAVTRYLAERRIEFNDPRMWILSVRRLQKGFGEGMKLMEQLGPELVEHSDEVVAGVLRRLDLGSCEMKVLKDAGILDLHAMKADVIRAMVGVLLKEIPRV